VYDARDMDPVRPDVRPRISVFDAWREGWRRVFGAPVLVAGLVVAVAVATEWQWLPRPPAAWAPGAFAALHLKWVFANEPYAFGGVAAFVARLLAVLTAPATGFVTDWDRQEPVGLASQFVLWMFLAGGALDRLARARPIGVYGFFAASGVFFLRFLRLGVVLGGADWIFWRWILPFVQEGLFAVVPYGAPPTGLALSTLFVATVAIVGDFAEVRAVVEDRRSAVGALGGALRFVGRRPARATALYVLNLVPAVGLSWLVSRLTPFASEVAPAALAVWLWIGLIVHVVVRLAFMATSIAFFQGELAHAGYTAAPVPAWPDSPSVEAIANLADRRRSATDRALPL
jgi:hypothetical protein